MALVGFSGVEVSLRIAGDDVDTVEHSGLAASVAERRELLEGVSTQDVDQLVFPVSDVQVRLLRIRREREVPDRPSITCFLGNKGLLQELARLREYLNPVALSIADVHEVIF